MANAVYEKMNNRVKVTVSALNRNQVGNLLAVVSILLGGWFRIYPAFLAGFPVNDGGMFYTMIMDVQANHFWLPFNTSYNSLNIPFAYPPLAFYVGAVASYFFQVSLEEVIRWLPGIVNILCLVAFYFLAKEILIEPLVSGVSTFVYAMIPHMYEWPSMGGGLTRSFGMLFMMLTVLYAYRLFKNENQRDFLATVIFGSLTVLSHPESIVYTLGVCVCAWYGQSRTFKGFLYGVYIAIGVLLITLPWYGTIIYRHGIDVLLSAVQTGKHSLWSPLILMNMDGITSETYLDLLGVVCVLGIAVLVIRKEYFIPLMLIVIYLVGPRSAHTIGNIALALSGGFFITEVVLPSIGNSRRGFVIFLIIILPYLFINSAYQGYMIAKNHVGLSDRSAMQWVSQYAPVGSQFLILTGNTDAMCDSVSEWFPSLAKQSSLTTVQGREWLLGEKFQEFVDKRAEIQQCISEDLECINQRLGYFAKNIDYIYISNTPTMFRCVPNGVSQATPNVVKHLKLSSDYSLVYNLDGIFIFKNGK